MLRYLLIFGAVLMAVTTRDEEENEEEIENPMEDESVDNEIMDSPGDDSSEEWFWQVVKDIVQGQIPIYEMSLAFFGKSNLTSELCSPRNLETL